VGSARTKDVLNCMGFSIIFSDSPLVAPLTLILHSSFVFLFKRWIGPVGTYYASVLVLTYTTLSVLDELKCIMYSGCYAFSDLGRWFYCLDILDSHLLLCSDSLALVSSTLVLVLTGLALSFGLEYMTREAFINRLLYLLNLFATSVILLFYSYDYFLIILAWECIGLFSFLLVNFYSTRIYTIKAALKTFVFSRISDMFMFTTFTLSILVFNTTDLSIIFLQVPFLSFHYMSVGAFSVHFLTTFSMSLALCGCIKSAQFFAHVWLPDAMEAPTPASALIHSSTLVVAGVYLIIRFSLVFEFALFTNLFLGLLGAVTLAFGAITATFQQDIKKLVAYSTISQIGYLVCGCGFCCYEEVLLYLIVHAMNKAFLFIVVGFIVHFFTGNTDMRRMGGFYPYSFDLTVLLFGAALGLSGLPYSAGFVAKEFLLFQVLKEDLYSLAVRGCWLVSFFFTPIYMMLLVFIVAFGSKKGVKVVYSSAWRAANYNSSNLKLNLAHAPTSFSTNWLKTGNTLLTRYQLTFLTSRTMTIILFTFWLLCLFFGNILISLILNFNSLCDTIPGSYFATSKEHVIFNTFSSQPVVSTRITFLLLLFTLHALFYLINLKASAAYSPVTTLISNRQFLSFIALAALAVFAVIPLSFDCASNPELLISLVLGRFR